MSTKRTRFRCECCGKDVKGESDVSIRTELISPSIMSDDGVEIFGILTMAFVSVELGGYTDKEPLRFIKELCKGCREKLAKKVVVTIPTTAGSSAHAGN